MDKVYVAHSPQERSSVRRLVDSLKRLSPRLDFSPTERPTPRGRVVEETTHDAIQDADVFILCAPSAFRSADRETIATMEERTAIERLESDPAFRVVNVVLDRTARVPKAFHSWPIIDLSQPEAWENSVQALWRLLRVHQEEREVDGPKPIERTLFLDSEPIAVAYLDQKGTECTMAWPLNSEVRLKDVLDSCLSNFLPSYSPPPQEKTLEFWIGDEYRTEWIGSEPTTRLIFEKLTAAKSNAEDGPDLVQITSNDVVIESVFDESTANPVRLAVLISVVHLEALVHFFSRFHRNEEVRTNPEIAARAFVGGKSLFHPLPMLSNVSLDRHVSQSCQPESATYSQAEET